MQKAFRFTSLTFDDSTIYWGTDDIMKGNALFIKAKKTEPLQVTVQAEFDNVIRTGTLTNIGTIFISESGGSRDNQNIDFSIHLVDQHLNLVKIYSENSSNSNRKGFTYSRASVKANENTFFSYFDGSALFKGEKGMIKWKLVEN